MGSLLAITSILAIICLCVDTSILQKRETSLVVLDGFNTQSLDKEVRKQIMLQVVEKAQQSVNYQNTIKKQCETALNQTIDQCNACTQKSCGSSAHTSHSSTNVWQMVLPALLDPSIRTGLLVTGIEKTAGVAFKFLGSSGEKFISKLGSLGKNVGESLIGGTKDIINDVGGKLTGFGNNVAKLVSNIGNGLDSVVSGIPNLVSQVGNGLDHFGDQLKNGAQTALNGLSHGTVDVGHQIGNGAKTIGGAVGGIVKNVFSGIKGLFGKRMAPCAAGCQSCTKIDTKSHSSSQILTAVCGTGYTQKQQEIMNEATKMKNLYDLALNHTIIQKVEYDPTSIDPAHGVAFRRAYITVNLNGSPKRFQSNGLMKLTDIPSWSKDLSTEIWEL